MFFILESLKLLFASIRSLFGMVRGLYWLSRLNPPIITIFGGRSAGALALYAQQAHDVAQLCVERDFAVLSGGGPGMMQAANCGAFEGSLKKKYKPICTFGIGVRGVDDNYVNVSAPVLRVDSFFTRKWLLTRYSSAFIVFPGGIGTADELFEVLNLMKLGKLETKPVILFGSAYWQPLVTWFESSGIHQGFIAQHNRKLFHVTDDVQGVMNIISESLSRKII